MASSPFGTFNGVEPFAIFPGVGLHPIAGDQVFLGHVVYEAGTTVKRHSHEHTEQAMLVLEGSVTMTIGDQTRELGQGRHLHRQPRRRARALLGARRHVHRGPRAGAARPHRRSRARPRARRPERVAARRALAEAMATFGLVHGAWHGAWCWDRLVPELEAARAPRRRRRPARVRPGRRADALRRGDLGRARRRRRRRARRPLARRLCDPARRGAEAGSSPRLPLRADPGSRQERDRPLHDRGRLRARVRREHRDER